ncbi:MAG TPA: MIP/aquaporin family protein [Flavisolibacter sp.]
MKKNTVEFIGTFFLVAGALFGGAIGASLALMVVIYAGGHISGAHYNPAVTVAMLIRKKITTAELPGYFIAQFLGAALAAVLVYYVFEKQGVVADCTPLDEMTGRAFAAELISTFLLAFVVLNVATAKGTAGNSFYGLAIAGTVLAMAMAFGQYSGGVFNPAVGVGLAIHKSICWNQLWLFFVAPVAGGVLAAYVFRWTNGADDEEPESIPEDPELRNAGSLPR